MFAGLSMVSAVLARVIDGGVGKGKQMFGVARAIDIAVFKWTELTWMFYIRSD
jgi:hypothetical protein